MIGHQYPGVYSDNVFLYSTGMPVSVCCIIVFTDNEDTSSIFAMLLNV